MVVYLSHCCITDVYIVPWRAGCCDSLSPHCVPVNMAHPSPPPPPLSHWFNSLPFYLWALVKAFRCKTFGFRWYKLMTDAKEVEKLLSPVTQRWNSLLNRMCSGEFIPSDHTCWLILFALLPDPVPSTSNNIPTVWQTGPDWAQIVIAEGGSLTQLMMLRAKCSVCWGLLEYWCNDILSSFLSCLLSSFSTFPYPFFSLVPPCLSLLCH